MPGGEHPHRKEPRGSQSDHLLGLIVDSANNPIFLIDPEGQIKYVNAAGSSFHRQNGESLLGQPLNRFITLSGATEGHDTVLQHIKAHLHLEGEARYYHGDGSCTPVWLSLFPLPADDTPPHSAAILIDLQPYFRALAKATRQLEEVQLLNKVSMAVSSSLELEQILSILLEETRSTLNAEACSVALLDKERDDLFFLMAEGVGATRVRGTRMPADLGVIGAVVRKGEPKIVPDVDADPHFFAGIDNLTGARTRSLMCTPLKAHGIVIGALEAMNKTTGDFDQEDLRLFDLIAASTATAISNALLYQEQRQTADELMRKNSELILSREREIKNERMAVLDQISASLRHEVNNPLTGILSLSEWLLRRQDLPENLVTDLVTIRDQAARIRDIVRRLSEIDEDRTVTYLGDRKMIDLSPKPNS